MIVSYASERGAMTVWVAVLLGFMLVGFGGLVYDGSGAATMRSEVIDAAWSLARTGAAQTVAETEGVVVDADAAHAAIEEAASRQWPEFEVQSTVGSDGVTVTVTGSYEPALLHLLGYDDWDLSATRSSDLEFADR